MQQILDIALANATPVEQARFAMLLGEAPAPGSVLQHPADDQVQPLRVAIAAVVRDSEVLLVCRRGDDAGGVRWQFPAGIVKPWLSVEQVAVGETFGETGIHSAIRDHLGGRLHPISKVYCEYFLCEYLSGEIENRDILENVDVTWAKIDQLTRFIPRESIYPPLLKVLEGSDDTAAS
ncbi:NUDIX domain-containing protein [Actinopolymorpha sp. B11F2]|uniref:NUDIX hydrolase n=1 Tax=Actinopolymorpha sp. B11F2 TaxID=3160862 RepID=UPI0032E3A107